MPKGVEHQRDKTQSLILVRVESLMPKGVEHDRYPVFVNYYLQRVESLMPKGVEHHEKKTKTNKAYCVESLMPKGVEHINQG